MPLIARGKTSQAEKDNYLAIFEYMFYHRLMIGY